MRKGSTQTEEAKRKISDTKKKQYLLIRELPKVIFNLDVDEDTKRLLKSKLSIAIESIWGLK
jgi:hypothetical protein